MMSTKYFCRLSSKALFMLRNEFKKYTNALLILRNEFKNLLWYSKSNLKVYKSSFAAKKWIQKPAKVHSKLRNEFKSLLNLLWILRMNSKSLQTLLRCWEMNSKVRRRRTHFSKPSSLEPDFLKIDLRASCFIKWV